MGERVAFYVKSRPQGADIIDLVLRYRRVFIGYPPFRRDAEWNRHQVKECVLDISADHNHWDPEQIDRGWYRRFRRMISRNRNLARMIGPGSIVVVPRPSEGVCYLGRVDAPFTLENDPEWAEEYLAMREKQGVADDQHEKYHIADVVQCWRVEEWRRVPFAQIPRWIQYQLKARVTIGIIGERSDGQAALSVLEQLYAGQTVGDLRPVQSVEEILPRLLDWVSPSDFEYLVCDLLQREQPLRRWWPMGGSGDGGVDGMGVDQEGRVVGLLQCKWMLGEEPVGLATSLRDDLHRRWNGEGTVYLAFLCHRLRTWPAEPDGVRFLGPEAVVRMLWAHRESTPWGARLGLI